MKAYKWNFRTKKYKKVDIPSECFLAFIADDYDEKVPCAECGKAQEIGSMFSSRRLHTENGIAYLVCSDCYAEEIAEEAEAFKERLGIEK